STRGLTPVVAVARVVALKAAVRSPGFSDRHTISLADSLPIPFPISLTDSLSDSLSVLSSCAKCSRARRNSNAGHRVTRTHLRQTQRGALGKIVCLIGSLIECDAVNICRSLPPRARWKAGRGDPISIREFRPALGELLLQAGDDAGMHLADARFAEVQS